jgi:hypothetical protein
MNDTGNGILERVMFHLRAQKRVALEADDVAAYQATHEALYTVRDALKVLKREQEQQRREHTAQLRRAA